MIRKTIASLFILVFALLTVPTLFLRSITTTYLDPKFYEGPVLDEAYSYSVKFASDEISKNPEVTKYFSRDDIKKLIEENFTKDNVREVAKDFIAQLKAISDKRKTDAIKISLLPVKENIAKMSDMIAEKILADVATCTDESAALVATAEVPACIPQSIDRNQIKSEIKNRIEKGLTDLIPGEFIIDTAQTDQMKLFEVLNVVHYAEMILPLFMLIVLLLIMLIIYKPYTRVMGFSGAALLVGGIFGLGTVQLIKYLPGIINSSSNNVEILNLSTLIIGVFTQKMTVYSLWFLGIGIIIILLAIFLRKSRHNTEVHDA